jgi:mono/diheme cytochrome c family protein
MTRTLWPRLALAFVSGIGAAWTTRFLLAQATPQTAQTPPAAAAAPADGAFEQQVKPFLQKNCAQCHNADNMTAGVRVDHLDASLDERHIRLWEGIKHRVENGTMPPKGLPQPSPADRQNVVGWINKNLEIAKLRPSPKNGSVRRLTVAQYKNTLRELLQLEDDVADTLPPDAVSADGFVNNHETLQLSPLLLEAYFSIAEEALNRSIVDPKSKPTIQNFRVDLGAGVNPKPLPEKLVLGANSLLLENQDFTVTELTPVKPFAFDPFRFQTKLRYIEGYQGNDTVRGWRDFNSIYHVVFACMRGKMGYPKGEAYSTVPRGLLLRPAIPNEEMFETDGTYGPNANFKISLRELPDDGRFRVTVMAAKYNDGLLLEPSPQAPATQPERPETPETIVGRDPKKPQTVTIPKAGIYQASVHLKKYEPAAPDGTRLSEGLAGSWTFDGEAPGRLEGDARLVDSPFGKALTLDGDGDWVTVARDQSMSVGEGDFTVAAWIQPQQLRRAGIIGLGAHGDKHGWFLEMPNDRGVLRLDSTGPNGQPNGTVATPPQTLRAGTWQHIAAVVRRKGETRLYLNGFPIVKGEIGPANLDNPEVALHLGRIPEAQQFKGEIDEVRLYRRALGAGEIQALLERGRNFVVAPPEEKPRELTLTLGDREFSGALRDPRFLAVRLPAGPLAVKATYAGIQEMDRVVLKPLAETDETAKRFLTFEKRSPRVGVHFGIRRDCGSTLAPVGAPQTVASDQLTRFVFEGAIRNYPSPDVEKDNVNYLAGIREIGVRSEFTDGRDMPRLMIRSVEFEGPFYESWPPPSHRSIFISSDARQVIRNFATRAYRRPITASEEAALMAVYQKSVAAGGSFQQSVKDTLQVVLTSPQFLFIVEKSSTPKPEPLDSYELSSKLSYFLWNGPPDRTTLNLAAAGTLAKQLDTEVERMIAHPRFSRFVKEFASQWLALDKFSVLEPDRKRFPNLTRDTRAALRQEPVEFVQYLIRNNLPVRNLVDSDFVVANEIVASYYDLGDKTEKGFQFTAIPHGRKELGGVLTQASILAGLSDGRESNPVKRGAWLARRIIAEPPPPPPPNVPALQEDTKGLTLRQRIEQHRSLPGCQQCHMKIDPWGVAFEEFDAGGRLKAEPADARSQLPDKTEVAGAVDLKRYLAEDRIDQVAFSTLKHLATYATGRTLTYNELHYLKQDGLKLKASGYRMKDMVRYVVNSRIFLEK